MGGSLNDPEVQDLYMRLQDRISVRTQQAGGLEGCTSPSLAWSLYEMYTDAAEFQAGIVRDVSLSKAREWRGVYSRLTDRP